MKANKKITKIIACIMIFISFVMITGIVKSQDISGDLYNGRIVDLNVRYMFIENPNLYCAQRGTDFSSNGDIQYEVVGPHTVEDDVFAYIINLAPTDKARNVWELDGESYKLTDYKQNLIWWYLSTQSNNDVDWIKEQLGVQGSEPLDGISSMSVERISSYKDEANQYYNQLKNARPIEIGSTEIVDDKVKVNLSGTTGSKYRIYTSTDGENWTLYKDNQTYNTNSRSIEIDLDQFGANPSSVHVKVVTYVEKYTATIWALQNSNSQGLIYVQGNGTTDYDIGEDTGNDEGSVDVSLQKYIVRIEDNFGNVKKDYNSERINKKANDNTVDLIYRTENGDQNSSGTNKYDIPMEIEVGDWVTYKIHVYNDSDVELSHVTVLDILPNEYIGEYKLLDKDKNVIEQGELTGAEKISYQTGIIQPWKNTHFYVKAQFIKYTSERLENKAEIYSATANGQNVTQGKYRWEDSDYVVMKDYKVSLQKFVYSVNGTELTSSRSDNEIYRNLSEKLKDNDVKTWNGTKWRNPVTVNKNDYVTYEIQVTNDGETNIKVIVIEDTIIGTELDGTGIGFEGYYWGQYVEGKALNTYNSYNNRTYHQMKDEDGDGILLKPGETMSAWITLKVSESNMSLNTLTNRAEIYALVNMNGITIEDTTIYDNMDEDYIKTGDITISGTVWNDVATGKTNNEYNGLYDGEEKVLEDIIVYLYRDGIDLPIAVTKTGTDGKYEFTKESIGVVPKGIENVEVANNLPNVAKFIKAPAVSGGYQYWTIVDNISLQKVRELAELFGLGENDPINANGSFNPKYSDNSDYSAYEEVGYGKVDENGYFSYYVVFEYDGITYTSTAMQDVTSTNSLDSNASEQVLEENNFGLDLKTRKEFNAQFETISFDTEINGRKISYNTENSFGYNPQTSHMYNEEIMAMNSSTRKINLSNSEDLKEQLTHVNLGLKGRDIFDLQLESDVNNVKVTVNGVSENYTYGVNKVTVRKSDIDVVEDTANKASELITESTSSRVNQGVRTSDIYNEDYNVNGEKGNTGLGIEVTYKITVNNVSSTIGTATKIVDYYDSRYEFKRAEDVEGNKLNVVENIETKSNLFNGVRVEASDSMIEEAYNSGKMEIYVVYELKDAAETLEDLLEELEEIATFNMAEIYEYHTKTPEDSNKEYTRGLLDKDSAPGNANLQNAYIDDANIGDHGSASVTTAEYYFSKITNPNVDLSILKYEDDTYTAPILYFVSSDNMRILNGKVFRDSTTTDSTTKIKSGNGIIDQGEVGIYGATVELIVEQVDGEKVKYTTTTGKDGNYTFTGFLPGKCIIKYYYGDSEETVLLNQGGQDINKYSFNGEDYQSTNNTGKNGGSALNSTTDYWYLFNEVDGISVATDDTERRVKVSKTVTAYTDDDMKLLNDIRDGKTIDEDKVTKIINDTKMNATTQNILFGVEKPVLVDNQVAARQKFEEYIVSNMNFGIAEVPVTTIDLQKYVKSFTITDSTSENILASLNKEDGKWKIKGDVIAPENSNNIDVSIEDDKLQGARLEVTYEIVSEMTTEKNFDGKALTVPTITGIVDYINNNLSYNSSLGENSKYWEETTYEDVKKMFEASKGKDGTTPQGTVDASKYTTIVKAKADNPILLNTDGVGRATITLEKVLSSTDATIEDIITSSVDTFEYNNTIEITGMDYDNLIPEGDDPGLLDPPTDRVRTPNRYIIIPGEQWNTASSSIIAIHPPTGDSGVNMVYYIMALISLVILTAGVFGVRKFVLSSKK